MKNKIKEKIERLRRAYRIFKSLSYRNGAWYLTKNGVDYIVLYDRNFELYRASKLKIFLHRVNVAWLFAWDHDIKADGLYHIYSWGDKIEYQKIDYAFKF